MLIAGNFVSKYGTVFVFSLFQQTITVEDVKIISRALYSGRASGPNVRYKHCRLRHCIVCLCVCSPYDLLPFAYRNLLPFILAYIFLCYLLFIFSFENFLALFPGWMS